MDWLDERFRELTGKYKHYCSEWGDLPIDETSLEFTVCNCYPSTEEIEKLKLELKSNYKRAEGGDSE